MRLKCLAAVGSLAIMVPGWAHATSTKNFGTLCIAGSFNACASVSISTTGIFNNLNQQVGTSVSITIANLQALNSPLTGYGITAVGLIAPQISGIGNFSVTNNGALTHNGSKGNPNNPTIFTPQSVWTLNTQPIGGQPIYATAGINGVNGQIIGCLDANNSANAKAAWFKTCGSGSVTFTFTSTTIFDASQAQIAYKVQSGVGSFECRSDNSNGHLCGPPPPPTVVPEPVSMTLLGTGLVGLAGAGARRRRRKDPSQPS